MLQRTQIMLDEQTKQDLLLLSQATSQSMSQLVREFVSEKAKQAIKKLPKVKKLTAVESMLAMAESAKKYQNKGPKDLARNHDAYLY